MIETVVSVGLLVEEVLKIKKNRLSPDFPTGNEKRVCIVSGIYGDELSGQYICYEVIRRIKNEFDNLTGIVDIYPSLNPMGLDSKTRDIPGSQIDMNVIFPGSKSGDLGEYTASCIMDDIVGADLCIDIHASNMYIHEIPQIRLNDNMEDKLIPFANKLNVDMIWVHPSTQVLEGSISYALNAVGVNTMVVMSGIAHKLNQTFGDRIVEGIFALLKDMGMWKGNVCESKALNVIYDKDITYINSESSGIFIPSIELYNKVKTGDKIGVIVNVITGSIEEVIYSTGSGIICAIREYPVIEEGSLIARIAGGVYE